MHLFSIPGMFSFDNLVMVNIFFGKGCGKLAALSYWVNKLLFNLSTFILNLHKTPFVGQFDMFFKEYQSHSCFSSGFLTVAIKGVSRKISRRRGATEKARPKNSTIKPSSTISITYPGGLRPPCSRYRHPRLQFTVIVIWAIFGLFCYFSVFFSVRLALPSPPRTLSPPWYMSLNSFERVLNTNQQ